VLITKEYYSLESEKDISNLKIKRLDSSGPPKKGLKVILCPIATIKYFSL